MKYSPEVSERAVRKVREHQDEHGSDGMGGDQLDRREGAKGLFSRSQNGNPAWQPHGPPSVNRTDCTKEAG